MIRTPLRLLVLAVTSVVATAVLTGPTQAAPSCGITWGSTAEGDRTIDPAAGTTLTHVRAGRHDCFDRLVLDIDGPAPVSSWHVAYVDAVIEDPTGNPVPLRGGAFLQISVGVSDHDTQGLPTYCPADRRELVTTTGFRTFRQVAWAGSFEGVTNLGLGVRARLPFRVLTLSGGPADSRVVVDVAHRW